MFELTILYERSVSKDLDRSIEIELLIRVVSRVLFPIYGQKKELSY